MANEDQREYWNARAGEMWAAERKALDQGIAPHTDALLDAVDPQRGEQVLDVGCGTGATTMRLAQRVGEGGRVVGIDLSAPMLAAARKRCAREQMEVELRQADAQTETFEAESYDLVCSRFGVMFFDDPVAAFRNLRRAVKPSGRLGFVCWQSPRVNPWVSVPLGVLAQHVELPAPEPGAPGPFALASSERVESLLTDAGWHDLSIEPFVSEMHFGDGSVDFATDFFQKIGPVARTLSEIEDEHLKRQIVTAMREELARHVENDKLSLGSAVWLVKAQASR